MLCRNGHGCDLGAPPKAEESLPPNFQQDLSRDKLNGAYLCGTIKLVRHARGGGSFTHHNDPTCVKETLDMIRRGKTNLGVEY
jgi:hypothetical protein